MLFSATLDAGDRRPRQALPVQSRDAPGRLGAVAGLDDDPPRAARQPRRAACPCCSTSPRPPAARVVFTRTKHGAKKLAKQLNASGVPAVELHGNLSQNARTRNMDGVPLRHGLDAGRHRHRRPRHPRRRRRARHPRRPAGRAQGLPAPLRAHRPRRRRRHRHHADDRRPGARRARPDPARPASTPTTTRVHATHPLLAELAPGPRVPTSPIANRVAESSPRPPAGRSRQQRPAARPAARRSAPGQSDSARSGRRDGAAPAGGESGRPRRNNRPRRAGSTTTHTSSSSGYRSGGAAAFSAGSRVGSRQR